MVIIANVRLTQLSGVVPKKMVLTENLHGTHFSREGCPSLLLLGSFEPLANVLLGIPAAWVLSPS